MIGVKDKDGKEIKGLFRGVNGSLVVKNDKEFQQYQKMRQNQLKMQSMESELLEMKTLLRQLLQNDKK